MKTKRKKIIILMTAILMGIMLTLTGCSDRSDESIEQQPTRQQPTRGEFDPNRPPPERNPDGSLG